MQLSARKDNRPSVYNQIDWLETSGLENDERMCAWNMKNNNNNDISKNKQSKGSSSFIMTF